MRVGVESKIMVSIARDERQSMCEVVETVDHDINHLKVNDPGIDVSLAHTTVYIDVTALYCTEKSRESVIVVASWPKVDRPCDAIGAVSWWDQRDLA